MAPVKPRATKRAPNSAPEKKATGPADGWAKRAGRLYVELERSARTMVRRAFRSAFSDDEIDDIYAAAWLGTLRTLERRQAELSDEQIRKYLLAAVANQASKELRRRKRRPTAPLEIADPVADDAGAPDERALGAERSRMARDLLASLPPRRRAVMLLRYGWGLEPRQVCELVKLSPRAYRKEITRGVDELTERMRRLERGEWCAERAEVLKAYAAGLAGVEERLQAEAHLGHCRACADLVARVRGRLHELGAGLALSAALFEHHGAPSIPARISELGERIRDGLLSVLSRAPEGLQESVGSVVGSGGARGIASASGASLIAKLTQLGTVGKVAVACLAGGAAATACVSTGAIPGLGPAGAAGDRERAAPREPGEHPERPDDSTWSTPVDGEMRDSEQASSEASQHLEDPGYDASKVDRGGTGIRPADLEFGVAGGPANTGVGEYSPAGGSGNTAGGKGSVNGEFGSELGDRSGGGFAAPTTGGATGGSPGGGGDFADP
jgi:RNA polymerase sigma factor (sigma-70 family)